jgi:DNA polymerase I-like protein with 3'-5' exonuclease and polymerase domains
MLEISKYPVISFDTETDGLRYPINKAFMLTVAAPDGKTLCVDRRRDIQSWTKICDQLQRYQGLIVMHNAPFDYKMMYACGIRLPINNIDDTITRAVMIDENHGVIYPWTKGRMSYSLDDLARHYLGIRKDQSFYGKAREWFGNDKMTDKAIMSRISELPYEIVAPYAVQDAVATLALWQWQEKEIEEQGIREICDFERRVTPSLIRSQLRGINIDIDRTEQAIIEVDKQAQQAQRELDDFVGFKLNVNSSPQIKKLFNPTQNSDGTWVANDGTPLESTNKGQPSFGGNTMHEMKHPAAAKIIELRSLIKTSGTFLQRHILGHQVDGVVYPTINQTASEDGGTRTGRLSYVDPAMQQIPNRNKKVAAVIKPCFLPPAGMKWVDGDMQSFEVRVFASLVAAYNDAIMKVYAANPHTDFHRYVSELTGLVRDAEYSGQPNSKQLNLSMIFNSGNGAIAAKMGMPWEWAEFDTIEYGKPKTIRYKKAGPEAMRIINMYHSRVPGIKTLADKAKLIAESRGYIKTKYGRRLRFRKGYKSYAASGLLIQATSADINKENWVLTEEALGTDGHLMLNTHDSYSMAISPDWKKPYARVKEALERPALRVPLIFEFSGVGDNWWEALQKGK